MWNHTKPWVAEFRRRSRWIFRPKWTSTTMQMPNKDAFDDFLQGCIGRKMLFGNLFQHVSTKFLLGEGGPLFSIFSQWHGISKVNAVETHRVKFDRIGPFAGIAGFHLGGTRPTVFSNQTSRIQDLGISNSCHSHTALTWIALLVTAWRGGGPYTYLQPYLFYYMYRIFTYVYVPFGSHSKWPSSSQKRTYKYIYIHTYVSCCESRGFDLHHLISKCIIWKGDRFIVFEVPARSRQVLI